MSKLHYLIIGLLLWSNLFASGLSCKFEEVYQNGELQIGHLLIEEDKLRYEYFDPKLFTIIFVNDNLVVVENFETNKFQLIEKENSIIPELINIYKDFPDVMDNYKLNSLNISIEKKINKLFIKRLAIKSQNLNLSIFFFDCKKMKLDKLYFEFNPLKKYVPD